MRYLLDTHVAIWSAIDGDRLPPWVVQLLVEPDNDVYVSVVSLFEIAIKNAPGRRDRMPLLVEEAVRFFAEIPYAMLNIEPAHAAMLEALPPRHGDPFDRLLIAQAAASGMQLITHDRTLSLYGDMILAF